MKISDVLHEAVVSKFSLENWMSEDLYSMSQDGGILLEMANLKARITDLPSNIILWTRPDKGLPHTIYRMKVTKDHKHSCTYTVGSDPKIIHQPRVDRKYQLDAYEKSQVAKFISKFYPLLISYIDSKISAEDLEIEIQKINRSE